MKARDMVRWALCAALALTMVACGPIGGSSTPERIIIRAEDGMPPTRAAGPREMHPILQTTPASYPEPEITPTPTVTPAAYP